MVKELDVGVEELFEAGAVKDSRNPYGPLLSKAVRATLG